jgi:hypothetical protein
MNSGPILIIRITFPTLACVLLFLVIIKSENIKISFICWNHIENTKTPFIYSISLFYVFNFYYFLLLVVLIPIPYVWQPLGGVGDARQGVCFAGCLTRTNRPFSTAPLEFDIYSESSLWENYSCYNSMHFESQRSGTLLSVISNL